MKATQLIIEHLLTGIQAILWLLLFSMTIVGTDWLFISEIMNYETPLLAIIISITYPLGIVTDNLADKLLKKYEETIRIAIPGGNQSMRKLLLHLNNTDVTEYFDYLRTRIRICRSAGFNFLLITISSLLFTLTRFPFQEIWIYFILEIVVGFGLVIITFYSWVLLIQTFGRSIAKRYKEIN